MGGYWQGSSFTSRSHPIICRKPQDLYFRFMKRLLFFLPLLLLAACYQGKSVDLIVHNASIYTMDGENHVYEAMAIDKGIIVELGPERQILNKYRAIENIDAQGREVYPGFTDAHGHILSYASQKLQADLVNTRSFEEVVERLRRFDQKYSPRFLQGRGWDHSLWGSDSLPNNSVLNQLYPNKPVALIRVDGHAMLVNDYVLRMAKIQPDTKIEGGQIEVKNGRCSGILIDNAMELIHPLLPTVTKKELSAAILEVQDELLMFGITGVHEAGIEYEHINLFKTLVDEGKLKINLYAMLMPSDKNLEFAKRNGPFVYKNLSIRSFKVIGDGALGSRGACLKHTYADMPGHFGTLVTSIAKMREIAKICEQTGYQMNTHAIGDSTNKVMLDIYKEIRTYNPDHRWRIEHAQVVDPSDFILFSEYGVFPSVQPSHAISDQRWAENRLGKHRMQGAYAYKTLKENYGMITIGTDFPIEIIDPYRSIHAAVNRKDTENFPEGGFLSSEALTLDDCLRGMTIWAAIASFQEKSSGSLEKGKKGTFTILQKPLHPLQTNYVPNFAYRTYLEGKKVYSEK